MNESGTQEYGYHIFSISCLVGPPPLAADGITSGEGIMKTPDT